MIIQRAFTHVCATYHFADIIPDRTRLYYTVKALREKGELRFINYYQPPRGRPLDIFCNGYWPDKLAHDLGLSDLLIPHFAEVRTERGPFVDQTLRPDATLYFPGGEVWHWEYDTGHQTYAQVEKRWKSYRPLAEAWAKFAALPEEQQKNADTPAFVLVATCRKKIDRLVELAGPYAAFLHLAYAEDMARDPLGDVLYDVKVVDGKVRACEESQRFALPPKD